MIERRWLIQAMVLCGWLVFAARAAPCEQREGQARMKTSIELSASFEINQDQLVLTYEVVNHGDRDAYLLNRLYRTTPQWDMSPNVIYVHLDPAAETVWLNKKLADLPTGVGVSAPVAPFVTPLRAGSSFQEEVHIPLPLREYRQYKAGMAGQGEDNVRVYKYVYFSLGYYWRPHGTQEETSAVEGTEVIIPRTPRGASLEFGSLDTKLQRLDVPVIAPAASGRH